MSKIKVLPDIVANRIAAGEIVERPASVVKELLENALDAGARRVEVEIRAGGKELIRVRDDGEGMDRDDALLAFEHHATSKLRQAEDLDCIKTLGFRGEALPSIASVSRLTLKTSPRERPEAPGTLVEIHGGKVVDVRDLAWAGGTELAIENLFFNVPARRKFLRTEATESSHVARLTTHYALVRPETAFSLRHNGRTVLDAPPVKSLDERILQVFGDDFHRDMIPFASDSPALRCWGLLSPPHRKAASTEGQFFFINGRMVRDRVVSSALNQAYRGIIPGGTYPAAVVFLEVPFDQIDVNVHPAKTEVRFRNSWQVQNLLSQVMAEAIRGGRAFAQLPTAGRTGSPDGVFAFESVGLAGPAPSEGPAGLGPEEDGSVAADRVERVRQLLDHLPPPAPRRDFYPVREPVETARWEARPPAAVPEGAVPGQPPAFGVAGTETQALGKPALWGAAARSPWRVLGQWRESFIIAASRDELVVVDQHVAQERVLYEEFLAQVRQGRLAKQQLLLPVHVSLSPHQAEIWEELEARFTANGFDVERFGPRDALVKAVPAVAGHCEAELLLQDLASRLEDAPDGLSVDDARKRLAAGLSCKAAVKVNTPLSPEVMQHIVDHLLEADDPTTCPHGRPVVLRLNIRDIEKGFKRI